MSQRKQRKKKEEKKKGKERASFLSDIWQQQGRSWNDAMF